MLRKTISSKIKVLSLLMLFALFLAMPSVSHAKTSLTPAEIQAGFSRIALQYEAGEVLSETGR